MVNKFKNNTALGIVLILSVLFCWFIISILLYLAEAFDDQRMFVPAEYVNEISFSNTVFERAGDEIKVSTQVKNTGTADFTVLMLKFSFLDHQKNHVFLCEYKADKVFIAESTTELNHACSARGVGEEAVEYVVVSVKWGAVRTAAE